jgi:cytochrome c5
MLCIASVFFENKLWLNSTLEGKTLTAQMPDGMMNNGGMRGMMQRMMPDMLPPGIEPQDLPDPGSPGAKLVTRYCAQCHNLPSPAMHSAEKWPQVADRMFYRMSMMSGKMGMMNVEIPSPEEQRAIVAYLQNHGLKTLSPGALPSPESKGAALFRKSCSPCHALPDPKAHTAQEWPSIVDRMQAHMAAMGRTAISENEKKDIVNFLTRNARH